MIGNAAIFDKKIAIYELARTEDKDGFTTTAPSLYFSPWAMVKTTKGFTLISSGSSFEKAYTNFTIRYSETASKINRDMWIIYKGKKYTIEYINNIDEADIMIELQCKEVTK